MKRAVLFLMTFAVCILTSVNMMAQTDETTPLTAQQWKRGIAIVGQHAALDGRYGHPESEFPENYSLDDLNTVYKSQKWKAVYSALKEKENEGGNIEKLKEIAKEYTQPYGVVRKLNDYIAANPQPAAKPAATEENLATVPVDADGETVEANDADSIAVINASAGGEESGESNTMLIIINIILLLVSAAALYLAWIAKKENAELKKELDYKVDKLTSQFEKFSKNITTDLNRVTYMVNKRRPTEADAAVVEEVSADSEKLLKEPKRLFLTKPDANDYFIRSTEVVEIGNSIYELYTKDGVTGTFKVIDNPEVHQFALLMPTENLVRACTGNGIQISNGKTRIVTDREGTARFENGRWHVAVKAVIHYEA